MSAALIWQASYGAASFALRMSPNNRKHTSPFSKATQVIDFIGERWVATITVPINSYSIAQTVEALLAQLRGMDGTVEIWHLARPAPSGTMRGTPTLSATAAQGAQSLSVTTSVAGVTVKAGDMLGVGTQLVMVGADATAAGTALTVPLASRLRASVASGSAVVWDKPRAKFRLSSDTSGGEVTFKKTMSDPLQMEFTETF